MAGGLIYIYSSNPQLESYLRLGRARNARRASPRPSISWGGKRSRGLRGGETIAFTAFHTALELRADEVRESGCHGFVDGHVVVITEAM